MQPHRHSCEPLTAVALVCASRDDSIATLAQQISAFIDPTRSRQWTIERACEHGHVRLLQRLITTNADVHKPQLYRSHVFSRALAHAVTHDNDLALLVCLHAYCPDGFASLGMEAAARLGKLYTMQWLAQHCRSGLVWSSRFAEAAASNGHLSVLQWLATKFEPAPVRVCEILEVAVASSDVATVQWLLAQADRDELLDQYDRVNLVVAACSNGDFAMTQYLLTYCCNDDEPVMPSTRCLRAAVASGNLRLVEWLAANGCNGLLDVDIKIVADRGHIDVVQWMLAHDAAAQALDNSYVAAAATSANAALTHVLFACRPALFTADLLTRKFQSAAAARDLVLLQWLVARISAIGCPSVHYVRNAFASVIVAAKCGSLEIVQWLFAYVRSQIPDDDFVTSEIIESAVSNAAGSGHAPIVEWLHANRSPNARRPARYRLEHAAKHGQLALIQWLLAHAECADYSIELLAHAAASGDVATLAWLSSHLCCDRRQSDAGVMAAAVDADHVHIVQWLHATQQFDDWGADLLDRALSFEMVEWLHTHRPEGGCTTNAMDNAAARGDFDTLLYLHAHRSEGCSIDAAVRAQETNHRGVVEWLFATYPHIVMATDTIRMRLDQRADAFTVLFWAPQLRRDVSDDDGVQVTVRNYREETTTLTTKKRARE